MVTGKDIIILETRNVVRRIKSNGGLITTVNNVSYKFNKGRIFNLVGPSGAGKSSFLRLLNRLDDPTSGDIYYKNRPISSYKPTELRKKVVMLFQTTYLFPGTVGDNLAYCCVDKTEADTARLLTQVGLNADFVDKDTENLSGGERQRVALARALSLKPEVLLLDEPTASLDPSLSQTIEKLILDLSKNLFLTIISVTHDPSQARRLGGETLLLVSGRLIESGPTETVLTSPETEIARRYINRELV